MKIILSKDSTSFQFKPNYNHCSFIWKSKIGNDIHKIYITSILEQLSQFNTVSFDLIISSELSEHFRHVKICSNLIAPSIFNPNGQILSINLQKTNFYINQSFCATKNKIIDSYIDYITFDFIFESKRASSVLCNNFNVIIHLELEE